MKKIKKLLASFLIVLLVVVSSAPRFALAQEADPPAEEPPATQTTSEESSPPQEEQQTVEPTPIPDTQEADIENQAGVENDVTSEAITGENTIEEVTPTPTPDPEMCVEEIEEVEETSEPVAEEEEPEATASAVVETSDAASVTEVENSVNTTEVNSQTLMHTLNIYVNSAGDIDLTSTPLKIAEMVFGQDGRVDEVVNVQVLSIDNFAYLSNEIVNTADTGNNSLEAEDGSIQTGDAYSIVSLLNKVNTTIVDSTIHFVTINIFGNVDGNIILPEYQPEDVRACCGGAVNVGNSAQVSNVVDSAAVSGQNALITTSGEEATIETGSAQSSVNIVNLVNLNLINVIFRGLYINNLGSWIGDFLGWFGSEDSGNISALSMAEGGDCEGCRTDNASINNSALVANNVTSLANTGGNSLQGSGSIRTGNAFSSVNIVNLINSSIIGSWGYLAFINIFGSLTGDIGGESEFPAPQAQNSEPEPFTRETGGYLEVSHNHNVGNWVYPGDTVMFFATVKNPGSGIVYDTTLYIELLRNGVPSGGAFFNLGDILAHKSKKLTTGLVLSKGAKPGLYDVRVSVVGLVGPGDTEISAESFSAFSVAAFTPIASGIIDETNAAAEELPIPEVMGAIAPEGADLQKRLQLLFLLLSGVYVSGRGYQKRREIAAFVYNNKKYFGPAAVAIRGLLLKVGPLLSLVLSLGKHK